MPEGMKRQEIEDAFVREHSAPVDKAKSFVHLGADNEYHPTGGYWFPSGQTWGDASGWVSDLSEIPRGELVQFPRDDRDPEIRGRDDLPEWVANRYVE